MASEQARRVLARLAGDGLAEASGGTTDCDSWTPTATAYDDTIERASAALDDLDTAADFVEGRGLERLADAVERAEGDLSERAREGRATLDAYGEFRAVARGSDGSASYGAKEGRSGERSP